MRRLIAPACIMFISGIQCSVCATAHCGTAQRTPFSGSGGVAVSTSALPATSAVCVPPV